MKSVTLVALAGLVALGCHHGGGSTADAGDGVPGFPAQLTLGAAAGSVENWFSVDVNGSAEAPLGTLAFTRNVGTILLDGASVAAFIYARQQGGLYQGFAVGPDRWDVFWIYCTPELSGVYDERLAGDPMFFRMGAGDCTETFETTTTDVALPAATIAVPAPQPGIAVDGADLTVREDGTGTVTVAGKSLPLDVFGHIDCSTDCNVTPGWFALHALAWDADQQRALYMVMYLTIGSETQVELSYARSLPDLGDPIGDLTLPATWSAP